jgi:hypothetical protein
MRIYYYGKLISETKTESDNGSPVVHISEVLKDQFGYINKKNEDKDKQDEQKPGFVVRHYQNA